MFLRSRQCSVFVVLFFLLLAPALSSASAKPGKKSTAASAPSQWLAGVLSRGADSLNEKTKQTADRTAQVQSSLSDAAASLRELQRRAAILKTGIEVEAPPAPVVDQIFKNFSAIGEDISSQLDKVSDEINEARRLGAKQKVSLSAVDAQVQILKNMNQPGLWEGQIQSAYGKYATACAAFAAASGRLVSALDEKARLLKQEKKLLDGVLPRLKSLQQASMAGLLQCGDSKPLKQQFTDLCCGVGSMPRDACLWFSGMLRSVQLKPFLFKSWAPLTGLLLFAVSLGWAAIRLKRRLELLLDHVGPYARETGVRVLVSLARGMISMTYPIAFLLWLTAAYGVLGLFDVLPALIVLCILAGLAVVVMSMRVISDVFRGTGTDAACVPGVDRTAAPSFCRRLQGFAVYVVMGGIFIQILGLDKFPITLTLLVSRLYGIGVLFLTCLLLRPGYLKKIIDHQISSKWTKWLRCSWTALLLVLITVCLMELLRFESFAIYAIRAAVSTEALVACALLLAVMGKGVLKEIFEREHALLEVFSAVGIQFQQLYFPARMAFFAVIIAGLGAGLLLAWGLGTSSLMGFVNDLGKGVNLGSLRLSPLTVLASALVLYVGFRGSEPFSNISAPEHFTPNRLGFGGPVFDCNHSALHRNCRLRATGYERSRFSAWKPGDPCRRDGHRSRSRSAERDRKLR